MLSILISLAVASPAYPSTLESDLSTPCLPSCTVCHQTNAGGPGTATTAFATAMQAQGLVGGTNTDSLQTALDALTAAGTDSDGDGTPDVEQLAAGLDPNTGTDFCASDLPMPPHYGCGKSGAALLFGALFGVGGLRRKREEG